MARKKKAKPASPPRKPKPRSKRHSRGQEPIITDARDVARAARAAFKGFQKYDAKRPKKKLLPKSRLDAFGALIREGTTRVGGARTRKTVSKAATQAEAKARADVYELVQEARDLVAIAVTDDEPMRQAFLVGANVNPKSTPSVVKAAADVQQAWADKAYHARAVELGIDKAMIDKIIARRRVLTLADTDQAGQAGDKVGATAEAKATLGQIERETAYVRRVAKLAFKKTPETLATFRKRTPRAVARGPRKPPPSGEPSGKPGS